MTLGCWQASAVTQAWEEDVIVALYIVATISHRVVTCIAGSFECSFLLIAKNHIHRLPAIMSFLGGAECSTAGNPLSQFTKHVQDDKSLQRDRLVGRGPGGLQESFRSPANGSGQDEVSCLCTQT